MCAEDRTRSKRWMGNFLIFLAMGLGLLTGLFPMPYLHAAAETTSDLFLRLLKLVSLPIIFLAVTSTITGMRDFSEMRKLGRKVLLYTLATTLIAATIALLLYLTIQPASSLETPSAATESITGQGSYLTFLLNIIPSNIFQAFAEGNVMGVVFVALLLSVAILFLPLEQKTTLNQVFSSLFAAMIKVTSFIITLMPLAIWAFMTLLARDMGQNTAELSRLLLYLVCIVAANLLQGVLVLPLLLKCKKISPLKTFQGMARALTVAFFSKSSNATLPLAIHAAETRLGVSRRVSNFSLPLCSVINMNGCAAFILITVLFVASLNGVVFGATDFIGWVLLATCAAIGNAGVPMGCFFLTSGFLVGMDVPLYMMGLILPFYTLIDMLETALNVWSDTCITVVVDKELSATEAVGETSSEQARA